MTLARPVDAAAGHGGHRPEGDSFADRLALDPSLNRSAVPHSRSPTPAHLSKRALLPALTSLLVTPSGPTSPPIPFLPPEPSSKSLSQSGSDLQREITLSRHRLPLQFVLRGGENRWQAR